MSQIFRRKRNKNKYEDLQRDFTVNEEDEVKAFLEIAHKYYIDALKLLNEGDPYDAAEKIWAAVKNATIALTLKYLGETVPPKGVPWRQFVRETFMRAGLSEEEANEWAAYFIDVRDRLHGACFYGHYYEESEHKPLIDRAGEYLGLIEKLIGT